MRSAVAEQMNLLKGVVHYVSTSHLRDGRKMEPLEKLEIYIKIAEFFLQYKNSLEASAYINKAHQVCLRL